MTNRKNSTTAGATGTRFVSILGVVGVSILAASALHCGGSGDDNPGQPQGDAGPTITCGPGTVPNGNQCGTADAGAAGAGEQGPEGGVAGNPDTSCGPGTVLKDAQCVPAGDNIDGLSIDSFTATKLSGDVPLDTNLTWTIHAPAGTKFSCELDKDGDGVFETPITGCATTGLFPITYVWGKTTVATRDPRRR